MGYAEGRLTKPRMAIAAVVASVLLCAPAYGAAPANNGGYQPLFGTGEIRSSNIALFPKWKGALARYFDEKKLEEKASCKSSRFNRCHLAQWTGFLDRLREKAPMDQIVAINAYMNQKRYIIDPRNYGVRDYWATPREFLSRNGDCEDYAIAKYMSLRSLGFKDSQLRIVVLKDLNLGLPHAILVVYHKGRALVLDNQIKTVVPTDKVYHYKPYYSINEKHWWLHRPLMARSNRR
jgi:predicted transglutaminase-like cysteine proteinase